VSGKIIELFCEAIPGFLIQLSVYLIAPSRTVLFSLAISVLCAGFTSAIIAYDMDVLVDMRATQPRYYGFVPDAPRPRSLNFISMMLFGALNLTIRGFGMVMLSMVGTRYLVGYLACDQGLFLLQKAARGDMWYWLPIDGTVGMIISFMVRVMVKSVCDFTGCPLFRVAGELGGIYWIFSMISAVGVGFVSIPFYFVNTDAEEAVVDEKTAWIFMGYMSGTWLVSFSVFLLTMNREYIGTFFSFESGVQFFPTMFLEGKTDFERASIVEMNRRLWEPIRPQVKDFFRDNWVRWEEEQPEWFTAEFKTSLESDLLPAAELARQKAAGGGSRRRSSPLGRVVSEREGVYAAQVAPEPPL
jgi:hypothetical protein